MTGTRRVFESASVVVAVFGWLSVVTLLVAASSGLWLEFAYAPDARSAWDDIDLSRADIVRGMFIADIRRIFGFVALGSTTAWFVAMSATRYRQAATVGLVLALCMVAQWVTGATGLPQRWLFECGAAAIASVTAVYWQLAMRSPEVIGGGRAP